MFVEAADRYVEAVIPDAARAIDRLMRATEVERLPGVDPSTWRTRPSESLRGTFNRATRARVRLLAGL